MAKLLGIDVGTSGVKAMLIDEHGTVIRQAHAPVESYRPHPNWSEQNPSEWWTAVLTAIGEINEPRPHAIGLTGQMHGAVFLDEVGNVIRPAMLWNDQRTATECEEIGQAVGPEKVLSITGNPPLTGFQLPKILWLRKHEPENFAKVRKILLPKDYIRYRLSGVFATDVSDASGTGLVDLQKRNWSTSMLETLNLDPDYFPPIFESSQLTGTSVAIEPVMAAGIPIVAGAGDQAAGAVGTGAVIPGTVSVSLGTSGVVFATLPTPKIDPNGAVHTFCHANGGWHAMSVMLNCGGAVAWFREAFAPEISYPALDALADGSPPGADGLVFLPYLSGERSPHNDPLARGAFAGLTLGHNRGSLAKAMLEGVTFGLREGFDHLRALGAEAHEIRLTSGGAKSLVWRQMIADIFGAAVATMKVDEGPAYGSALLAGVGIGIWKSVPEAGQQAQVSQVVHPQAVDYEQSYERYKNLYVALTKWNDKGTLGP